MASTISIGVSLVGSGVSAAGSKKQGSELRKIGNFNAGVFRQQAQDALVRGRETEDQLKTGVRKLLGSQRAGFAAQGVVLDDGSALDVQTDTLVQQDLDVERIRVNAQREAWGFQQNATNAELSGQANFNKAQGQATGTILGGLGNAFSSYAKTSQYG